MNTADRSQLVIFCPFGRLLRQDAGEHMVKYGAGGIQICPGTLPAVGMILFLRHVSPFEDDGQIFVVIQTVFSGGTEIDQRQTVIRAENQIFRTDVPVDHSFFVHNKQSLQNRLHQCEGVIFCERLSLSEMENDDVMISYAQKLASGQNGALRQCRDKSMLAAIADGSMSNYGSVILHTHGNVRESRRSDGTQILYILADSEKGNAVYENLKKQYFYVYDEDEVDARLFMNSEDQIAVTSDYFMDVYRNRRFDNAIVYMNCCYGFADDKFKNFLLDHGAQAVIGCTDLIRANEYDFANTYLPVEHNWFSFWRRYQSPGRRDG